MVLKGADIIISTLNFTGNSLFDCLTSDKNNGQTMINVIIIDEVDFCLRLNVLKENCN